MVPLLQDERGGSQVTAVGTGAKEYQKIGIPGPGEITAESVNDSDFDAVIVSGYMPDRMSGNAAMLKLVRNCLTQGKIVELQSIHQVWTHQQI